MKKAIFEMYYDFQRNRFKTHLLIIECLAMNRGEKEKSSYYKVRYG
jgi:transcriptional accessory protein Tex/SPT6